jgi:molybdenum cofactor cytidylyltransferase
MKPSTRIEAVILAAGSASRFGSDKRLFKIDDVPMLQRVIANTIDAVDSLTVVLRSKDEVQLSELLGGFSSTPGVKVFCPANPESGMGSNLAAVIGELPLDVEGVMVVLADMPFIDQKTVHQVVNAYEKDRIIVPVYAHGVDSLRGHPVLFSQKYFRELMLLEGDQGARSLLFKYPDAVIHILTDDRGILQDIDVPPA